MTEEPKKRSGTLASGHQGQAELSPALRRALFRLFDRVVADLEGAGAAAVSTAGSTPTPPNLALDERAYARALRRHKPSLGVADDQAEERRNE